MLRLTLCVFGLFALMTATVDAYAQGMSGMGGTGGMGGSGDPPADNDTLAGWAVDPSSGSYDTSKSIWETAARPCHIAFLQTNGSSGDYNCVHGIQEVNFQLGPGETTKGDSGLCGGLTTTMVPNTDYDYRWFDEDCTSAEGCTVRVKNWFFEDPNRPAGTGLIVLEAFGNVANTSGVNPFADDHSGPDDAIRINEIRMSFKAEGKNNTLAACRWDATNSDVEFHTEPAP